jgi:hypothetical protein
MNKRRRKWTGKKIKQSITFDYLSSCVHNMIEKQKENCNDGKNEKERRVDERKQRRSNRYRF